MTNTVTIPLYEDLTGEKGQTVVAGEEAAAVQFARKEGFEHFKRMGFPTRRVEDWKYTNVLPFLQGTYKTIITEPVVFPSETVEHARIDGLDSYELVVINGELNKEASSISELPKGLHVSTIREARNNQQFEQYFTKGVDIERDHFAALNTALFSNGIFIVADPNVVVDKPLHIINIFLSDEADLFIQPRNLIIIGRSASVTLIESAVSRQSGKKVFTNGLSEVYLDKNSHCDHYLIQRAEAGSRWVYHTEVSQKRDSLYNNFTFSLPEAEFIRNNLNVSLDDEHTETHLFGLYLGIGNQLIDNHTSVKHNHPHCDSNEVYKGVLTDNATGVFNGKIYVHHDAQKTNAFQQNNNLLLGGTATINSKPQLEIFADDVKCSHGSTVGQLNKEALFYLQSRGISRESAKALLINAFAFDVTDKIKLPALKKHVNRQVSYYLKPEKSL